MRLFFSLLLLLCSGIYARKSFTPDYFVKKHNLKLPAITKKMLDVSRFTHTWHTRRYTYKGTSDKIDSVYSYLDLQAFPPNLEYKNYRYSNDTAFAHLIAVTMTTGDTTSRREYIITENGLREVIFNPETKCTTFVEYKDWGKRKSEKKKCPGDDEAVGQEFSFNEAGKYIESIETYRGKVDSSSIRRLYLTSFDSLVADYMVTDGVNPLLVGLNFYNKKQKVTEKYTFGIYDQNFKVTSFVKFTYNAADNVYHIYMFISVDRENLDKGYKLANYTEYEYDKRGRITTITTRDIPDPEYQKKDAAK